MTVAVKNVSMNFILRTRKLLVWGFRPGLKISMAFKVAINLYMGVEVNVICLLDCVEVNPQE